MKLYYKVTPETAARGCQEDECICKLKTGLNMFYLHNIGTFRKELTGSV